MNGDDWALWESIGVFVLAGAAILVFGILMTRVAAELARRTGLGEALLGALFIGVSTSLPEIVASTSAAYNGHPDLAASNALGSVAGQTAFLALADMSYRKANLEYSAASAANLMLAVFVIILLSIVLLAFALPEAAWWRVHPASVLLVAAYLYGIRLVSRVQDRPMWFPVHGGEERGAGAGSAASGDAGVRRLWLRFAYSAASTAAAGWLLAHSAVEISAYTGLSETVVGGLFTGVTGSLPELVSALSAVRIGALTLAVGGILGSNAFDTVIVGLSDLAYVEGPIFAGMGGDLVFLVALGILLTSIQLMGMVYREKHGVGNIGMESALVLGLYAGAFGLMFAIG
ncbi:MAG: sodium:calcium antiporter [Gammaproteobacteria bacterium]